LVLLLHSYAYTQMVYVEGLGRRAHWV